MMNLGLQIYQSNIAPGLATLPFSSRAQNVVFTTNEHGYDNLTAFIPLSFEKAFQYYDSLAGKHVTLSDGAFMAFEGRIEDARLVTGGLEVGAFGYWRALYDVPYTGLWSTQELRPWRPLTVNDIAGSTPDKFQISNNQERLAISLRNGESYATSGDNGRVGFQTLSRSENDIKFVTYTYDLYASSNFVGRLISNADINYGSVTSEWTLTGNGASQSATRTETLAASSRAIFFQLDADGAETVSDDTGDRYYEISAVRLLGGASSTEVYADEIAKALVAHVNGVNSSQLNSSTALIDSPAVDILEAVYEDKTPARILIDLAAMGDDSTPPEQYEVGVWEGQKLHFRQRGSKAQDWYIDAGDISIDSTLDTMYNSAYATYRTAGGRPQRTANSDDTESQAKYGITRRGFTRAGTTDTTEADVWRDAFLERTKDITPRSRLQVHDWIYTASGARMPAYHCRSGDTITIRNLPITGGATVDKIRKFTVARTSYDVDTRTLTPTPEMDLPDLGFMVARLAAQLAARTLPSGAGQGEGFTI